MKPVLIVAFVAPAGSQVALKFIYFVVFLMEHLLFAGAVLDVAASHVRLIKVLTTSQNVVLHYYFINFCPHTRTAEAISASAALVKSMFLHVVSRPNCKYCCFLGASSLNKFGVTVISNSSGAPDDEEDIVMKGGLEGFLGNLVEGNLEIEKEESQSENNNELILRHCWVELCSGWPFPRAVLVFNHEFSNHVGWISVGGFYTLCGTAIGGLIRGPRVDFEGCFHFMNLFEVTTTLACDLWVPKGFFGSRGVRRNLADIPGGSQASLLPFWHCAIALIHFDDLGAPQGSRGFLGVTDLFSRTLAVHRVILGVPQGFLGSPSEYGGRRFHRSARHRHSEVLLLEFGKSQPKKEGINELVLNQ